MRFPRYLRPLLALAFVSVAEANSYAPHLFVAEKFPPINGEVFAVCASPGDYDSGVVYVAGTFNEVGGQPRNHVAAFDLISGELTSWNPNVDGPVYALAVRNGVVYLGGDFDVVGGQARANLAAVNAKTGSLFSWSPDPDGAVRAIAFTGAGLYVGGAFSNIASQPRLRMASFDPGTLTLRSWNPGADGDVLALKSVGGTLYAGGDFQEVAGAPRPFAVAIDGVSGTPTAWNPAANGAVRALAFEESRIFAGGDFTEIGGQSRPYLAALDPVGGAALPWNPGPNGSVRAFAYHSHMLYLGGDFTSVGGAARSRLAAVDSRNGRLFRWNPGANGTVRTLQFSYSSLDPTYPFDAGLLIGGAFTTLDGKAASGLAGAFDNQWGGFPVATITKINGQSWRKLMRGERYFNSLTYETRRSRIKLRGWAVAGDYSQSRKLLTTNKVTGTADGDVSVEQVVIRQGQKTFRAHGTTAWSVTLRLRPGKTPVRILAVDSLGRTSSYVYQLGIQETDFSRLSVTRLAAPKK